LDNSAPMARKPKPPSSFHRFDSSPEAIRLVVMMYVKFPLSLRNTKDLLHERSIAWFRKSKAAFRKALMPLRLSWRLRIVEAL
jgi:transposase-like protein